MLAIKDRNTIKEILELPEGWTPQIAKANFFRLIKLYHPDVNKSPEAAEYSRKLIKAHNIVTGKEKPPRAPQMPQQPQGGRVVVYYSYGSGFGFGGGSDSSTGGFGF